MNKPLQQLIRNAGFAGALFLSASCFGQTVTAVKEVRVPGTTPLQIELNIGSQQAYSSNKPFVPNGKLAVIEHASFAGACIAKTHVLLFVVNPLAPAADTNQIAVWLGSVIETEPFGGVPIRLYLAAGATVQGFAARVNGSSCDVKVTLTGHWEDVPLTGGIFAPR